MIPVADIATDMDTGPLFPYTQDLQEPPIPGPNNFVKKNLELDPYDNVKPLKNPVPS